ncbi:glycosyltransferase family 2 protein [Pedobacter mucosus]|uniref:glycosyltransferase family 2 protein n=1 Tax=Pedobacter mucosus TaxID=2895286 RepID=UPI001EE3A58A|nr:glycosyltransferase family 2 protein [Pedobacter mucosus]UKT63249.1 glycosyltransferase [Pedobacter mucosus]
MPLISIITVTYNAEKFIESSIQSVLSQNATNYEYLMIDGGSTDKTIEIIRKYKEKVNLFISEPDEGIYDAMNKGINSAKGSYLFFLGADDTFFNKETLHNIAKILINKKPDLLIGLIKYDTGRLFNSCFGFKTLLHNTIHHQGSFYNKTLFNDFRFDINYKLIADYELNLKIYLNRNNYHIIFTKYIISLCGEGGESRTQLNNAYRETNQIRDKLLGRKSIVYKVLYKIKFLLGRCLTNVKAENN